MNHFDYAHWTTNALIIRLSAQYLLPKDRTLIEAELRRRVAS